MLDVSWFWNTYIIIKSTHLILVFWLCSPGQLGGCDLAKSPPQKMENLDSTPEKNLSSQHLQSFFRTTFFGGGGHTQKWHLQSSFFKVGQAFRERICSPHLENSLLAMFQLGRLSPKFLGEKQPRKQTWFTWKLKMKEEEKVLGAINFQVPVVWFFGGSGPDLSFISRSRLVCVFFQASKKKSPAKVKMFFSHRSPDAKKRHGGRRRPVPLFSWAKWQSSPDQFGFQQS